MKKLISVLLIVAMLLSLAACGQRNIPEETVPSDGSYPITLTDHAGRRVVIEKEPRRLISCYYITSSLLMALGLEENMVGIEDNPDYRPIYGLSSPRLLELPWVGTAKVLDVEACVALSRIYGQVSLQLCKTRSGKEVLTMLKEDVP